MRNQNLQILTVISVLILAVFSTHSLKAQSKIGLKGGILFSNIHKSGSDSNLEIEGKTGLSIGALYEKQNMLGIFGLQTELLYQQKGAEYFIRKLETNYINDGGNTIALPSSYYRDTENLHYLTIPVLLTVSANKYLKLYIGPEFGYLFSIKNKRIKTEEVNRFSAGLAAGLSFRLCKNTNLDFRYSYDLTPFDYMDSNKNSKLNSHGFTITIQQTIFSKQ